MEIVTVRDQIAYVTEMSKSYAQKRIVHIEYQKELSNDLSMTKEVFVKQKYPRFAPSMKKAIAAML